MCAKQVKNRNNKRKTGQKPLKQSASAKQLQARMNQTRSKRKKNRPQQSNPVKTHPVILASESVSETSAELSTKIDTDRQAASGDVDRGALAHGGALAQTITDKLESVAKAADADSPAVQTQAASEKLVLAQKTLEKIDQLQPESSEIAVQTEPELEKATQVEKAAQEQVESEKVAQAQPITPQEQPAAPQEQVEPEKVIQVQSVAPGKMEQVPPIIPEKKVQAQVEQEISVPKKSAHRKGFSGLWWLILAIILGLLGGVALWWYFTNQPADVAVITDDEISEPTTEPSDTEPGDESSDEPDKALETPPAEETPTEPEKPAEPQTPAEPQSTPTPLAARPNNTADPDVVPGHKVIALTFDDGPSGATTPRLLDILKNKGAKATFFVLGTMARRSPDLLRREVSEGHEVASHTPYHNQLTNLSWDQVHAEALEMDQIFREILGTVPPFTRPPYGSYNATVSSALGQPLILWSIDPRDWADRNANIVCSRVTSAAFDGAIILVHDIHATTVDAVPCIVDNLHAQGYQFLTVSELAAYRNVPLVNGVAYGKF